MGKRKIKVIPERNPTQQFSEAMELMIENQKKKADHFFNTKKTKVFNNKYKKANKMRVTQVTIEDLHFLENKLNVVITKREANSIMDDSLKQYKKEDVPKLLLYTKEDLKKKFAFVPLGEPDNSILEEIRIMKARGL